MPRSSAEASEQSKFIGWSRIPHPGEPRLSRVRARLPARPVPGARRDTRARRGAESPERGSPGVGGDRGRLRDSAMAVSGSLKHQRRGRVSPDWGVAGLKTPHGSPSRPPPPPSDARGADLLLPVQGADDGQDEDAHADQREGRQEHDVAGREVQLGAPAAGGTGRESHCALRPKSASSQPTH